MNSSGIKRGLAASAIAALAVTGLPFIASSASAASSASDTLAVGSVGPIRNGNVDGGSIIIKSNSDAIVAADLSVTPADYSGTPKAVGAGKELSSPAFDVDVIAFDLLDPDTDGDGDITTGSAKFADGTYHYNLQTAVTLGSATKASFGLVEDRAPVGAVNASDPKTVVEVTPTGAPASVDISTTTPATAVGNAVKYSVEVKDAAGNLTQLVNGESFDVTGTAGAGVAPGTSLDDTDFTTGKTTYSATPTAGGTQTVTVTGAVPPAASITDSQSVQVYENAGITKDEFALDTNADNWKDGVTPFGAPNDREIRVDQNSVTFSFTGTDADNDGKIDDAGKVVGLVLSSSSIKINGKAADVDPVIVPVLLDSNGKGSATVALSNVTAGSHLTFGAPLSGVAYTTVTMSRPRATDVATDAAVYVTKVGSPTAVTVSVTDQFGNAIGGPAQVSITRNPDAPRTANDGTTDRMTVDASGKATFSLPDAGTTTGTESLDINLFDDQFDGSADTTPDAAVINYTADGLGADYTVSGATSDATATKRTPIYDATATPGTDAQTITIAGGTPNAPVKVSVDNGAVILDGVSTLNKGVTSKTITLDNAGGASFNVAGTKTGVVTVTMESAGRTKSVKLTIAQPSGSAPADAARIATARNVALEAPEKAKSGETAIFTATVTDAFGNPVAGVPVADLPITVNGPANLQSSDSVTDANGQLHYTVILTDNANSPVTARINAKNEQFGSKADKIGAVDAPGLSASVDTATASVSDIINIAELQAAVDAAQAKVDAAQDVLDGAKDDLSVAKAEKSVAQAEVKQAKKDLKWAKKHHKGVKAAQKALRVAKGDLKVAKAQVNAAQAKVNRAKDRLKAAQAELAAAQQALEDAQNS